MISHFLLHRKWLFFLLFSFFHYLFSYSPLFIFTLSYSILFGYLFIFSLLLLLLYRFLYDFYFFVYSPVDLCYFFLLDFFILFHFISFPESFSRHFSMPFVAIDRCERESSIKMMTAGRPAMTLSLHLADSFSTHTKIRVLHSQHCALYFTVVHTSGISWKSELGSRSRKHTHTHSAHIVLTCRMGIERRTLFLEGRWTVSPLPLSSLQSSRKLGE